MENGGLWEYYFSLSVGLYEAERENNSSEGGQPGPGGSAWSWSLHTTPSRRAPGPWSCQGSKSQTWLGFYFPALGLDLLPGSLPVASLLRSVPLVPVLASLRSLDWHPALELVLPLVIKDNEPLQSIQPQLSRKGTRHVSRSSQRHYCNRKHLALTL